MIRVSVNGRPWGALVGALVPLFLSLAPGLLFAQEADPGWPRDIVMPQGTITVYQPQPEALEGNVLKGRAATSILKAGATEPVFGVFWFQGRLDVDRDARMAVISDVLITRVRFPEATPEEAMAYIAIVEVEVPKWQHPISLDRLVASLNAAWAEQQSAEGLQNDPPDIVVLDRPALLLLYDGEPALRDIPGTSLQRVVNTPYSVLFDPAVKSYYLTNTAQWYSAPDPMGPWKAGATPTPAVAAAIPKEAKEAAAQDRTSRAGDRPLTLVAAKEPTELLWTDGKPQMKPLGTDLLYVQNTDGDLFVDVPSKAYFVLLSGRWYRAASLQGPWSFVKPTDLPSSFSTIPPASAKGAVRASVPGTEESKDALMDAQIPQTASIEPGVAEGVEVNYDGEPQFEPVEGTNFFYATNTGQQVLKVGEKYYLCQEGVWYVSPLPTGPWSVSNSRPEGVDTIPPSNPLYNTKYVYVYGATPTAVYVGYTPGYVGAYPYYGTVVYGTGWYYPGWVGAYYYPRSWTWGWGAFYNPWRGWGYRGGFGHGFAWGFAWGASLSHWGHGGGCWHGGGYFGGGIHVGNINIGVHPGGGPANRPGAHPGTRPSQLPANMYNRGSNAGRRATVNPLDRAGRPGANAPHVSQGKPNNVLASKEGDLYRKQGGAWEQRDKGGWKGEGLPTARPQAGAGAKAAPADVNRDYQARQRGASQTRSFSQGGGGRRR